MKIIPDPNVLAARILNATIARDAARFDARQLFELGHCQQAVRSLILTMRRLNGEIVRAKRALHT
jgi:hypothetical protein